MIENADKVYYFGDAIKTVGDTVKGYLVRFGSPDDTDLEGDYFTPNTDFGRPMKEGQKFALNLYYHHGQDSVLGTKSIGTGFVKMDNVGLWYEAQIDMSDEYGKMIAELAKKGKLGYSSGAAGHMVERTKKGNSYEITRWTIGEASLTPRPAESRNIATIKSLETKANPEDLSVGDYVRWMAYGTTVRGQIIDISKDGFLTGEPLGTRMEGTENNPVYKIKVYQRQEDGSYEMDSATTVHRASALTKIDKPYKEMYVCPECGEEMEEEDDEMVCKACGYKPKKSFEPHRPVDVRDCEATLREAMKLSRSESKKLANILWMNLCDANSKDEIKNSETEVKTEDIANKTLKLKQMLLKKAMLDILEI